MKLPIKIACLAQASAIAMLIIPAYAGGSTISPGHAVGPLRLGARASILDKIGHPAPGHEGDTAMGHTWAVYQSRDGRRQWHVYTVRDETGLITTIRQIEVNSPTFYTPQGIHTGDTLRTILRRFPHATLTARGTLRKSIELYDDKAQGIAFEFKPAANVSQKRCTAILIHPKGKSATEEYASLFEPLRR